MKKVAFITSEYPLPNLAYSGGIGTSIKNLAEQYHLEGISVYVFLYGRDRDAVEVHQGITFIFIKQIKIASLGWLMNRKRIQRIINKWIENEGIQLIEVPDWTGISAFIRFNCITVLKLHGSDTYFCHLEGRKVKSRNKWFEKLAFKNADLIIAVSDFVGKTSCELFGIERSYEVIHNGIHLDLFKHKESVGRQDEPLTILYFGSLIRKKGVLEIPEIFNRVVLEFPNVKLELAGNDAFDIYTGSGSTWSLMKEKFSQEARPKVEYHGLVKHFQINELIENASVCIFPSYAEAFPVSWLEALAIGKSVVCSDIGWSKEVILNDSVGLVANPSDHETFASKIINLLNNPSLRASLSLGARACVEKNFSINKVVSQHIQLLSGRIK
jgi:glycosyltransferase involved in cell wall biosynthesis